MPFAPFHSRFPEVAEREVRVAMLLNDVNDYGLPADTYAMIEMYCDEPNCDCRRVLLAVSGVRSGPLAMVNFGWEPLSFYAGFCGPEHAVELKGPNLLAGAEIFTERSHEALLLAASVLSDADYVARCQRHYAMFRADIAANPPAWHAEMPGFVPVPPRDTARRRQVDAARKSAAFNARRRPKR